MVSYTIAKTKDKNQQENQKLIFSETSVFPALDSTIQISHKKERIFGIHDHSENFPHQKMGIGGEM